MFKYFEDQKRVDHEENLHKLQQIIKIQHQYFKKRDEWLESKLENAKKSQDDKKKEQSKATGKGKQKKKPLGLINEEKHKTLVENRKKTSIVLNRTLKAETKVKKDDMDCSKRDGKDLDWLNFDLFAKKYTETDEAGMDKSDKFYKRLNENKKITVQMLRKSRHDKSLVEKIINKTTEKEDSQKHPFIEPQCQVKHNKPVKPISKVSNFSDTAIDKPIEPMRLEVLAKMNLIEWEPLSLMAASETKRCLYPRSITSKEKTATTFKSTVRFWPCG
ncbi:hypothetical protein ROZALSC1DRAFT_27687 [Rozella allomycis CSF55]|uniref:Uncharacterized protein n=1 Tax=Rozella allomycis (strain CSF55) TaxID=988480 RepID=A0A4V1J0A3_ROZAC|nr:hypothetical protein ROZALSC1DRAFT_27687 [Rozella allomycis CSF55]